ncbi:transposase (plasmid) [Citricoccus nitrophenolicus]
MLKRYRYRAYPTAPQRENLARLFGCVRVVYNDAVMLRVNARKAGLPYPTRGEVSRALTLSKQTSEREWLKEVSSVALQQALGDVERAFKNFFDSRTGKRKGQKAGAPKLKRRGNRQSARFTSNAMFRITETTHGVGFVTLQKIGRVRFNLSRTLPSPPTSVTIIKDPDGRYYVSFVVDVPGPKGVPETTTVAGVDFGLAHLAVIARSNGDRAKADNPRWMRSRERQLADAQRTMDRKELRSANWHKARLKVVIAHRKMREARTDHHRKLALKLVRENQAVCLEGLSVTGMIKTTVGKSVQDAGWSTLARLVTQKAAEYGRDVVVIDRFAPTTQTCSVCGVKDGPKPLKVRIWECGSCGTLLDRDYNAAVNIMVAAGLAETLNACGGDVRRQLAAADPR